MSKLVDKYTNKYVVILARASTEKQIMEGDTNKDQEARCRYFLIEEGFRNDDIKKVFSLAETGTDKERSVFEEVLSYCCNAKNNIGLLVFIDISRFTRGGVNIYTELKAKLAKSGVDIKDVSGIIAAPKNTMDDLGFEYNWSMYSPSESAEMYEAQRSKDELRTILTRMIRAEIKYAKEGYWSRPAPLGYTNSKVLDTEGKKRAILTPHEVESFWFIKMFELASDGVLSDLEICDEINKMGFKTRQRIVRDTQTRLPISISEGSSLNPKKLRYYLAKPIYAGIVCEKWTHFVPIKAKFIGLVSYETFNKANKGKVYVLNNQDGSIQLIKNYKPQSKTKSNPSYPFKNVVLCPLCFKPLLGSASTGKGGIPRPAYHCARKHSRFGVKKSTFENTITAFAKSVKFTKEFTTLFKDTVLDVWDSEKDKRLQSNIDHSQKVISMEKEKQNILRMIKTTESDIVRKDLEKEYESLCLNIALEMDVRDNQKQTELDLEIVINKASYFLEHPYEFLAASEDPLEKEQLFSLFFDKLPSYDQILNGTPSLSCVFELSRNQNVSKVQLVTLRGIEPRLPG